MRRATHQVLDWPRVLDDPLAVSIAGAELEQEGVAQRFYSRAMRAFLVVRSRYAEDMLGQAVEAGVRQFVILGAGLDTFAYRNPWRAAGLRVFEVDHPATQEWKRARLNEANIAIPEGVTFAPIDFEKQMLGDGLKATGFDTGAPAFFSWLGVTPYISRAAFDGTIRFIAGVPAGSGVVFDYGVERRLLTPMQQAALDAVSARVAQAGEPFQLFFDPAKLTADLSQAGFSGIEDLTGADINRRYFDGRSDGLAVSGGGHLLSAWIKS